MRNMSVICLSAIVAQAWPKLTTLRHKSDTEGSITNIIDDILDRLIDQLLDQEPQSPGVEPTKPVVLITGISGYIGSQVCHYFLKDGGFIVRGTVRDKDDEHKIGPLRQAFGQAFNKIDLRNADLLDEASLDNAIEGATYVVHTASPFHFKAQHIEELIKPAVDGTLGVLRACHKHRVKRVVVTSSRAAISFGHDPAEKVYNETHWSNLKFLEAKGVDFLGGYILSKTLAEKAAWDFQRRLPEAEQFELVCVNPCLVIGPAFVGSGFTSGEWMADMMTGRKRITKSKLTLVDVRSVAEAHLNGIKLPEAANQRFMLINGNYWMKDLAKTLHDEFATQGWPIKIEETGCEQPYSDYDTSLSQNVLHIKYEKDIGKVLVDMANSMIETGALEKP